MTFGLQTISVVFFFFDGRFGVKTVTVNMMADTEQ